MFRRILGIVWLAALGLQGPSAFALAASSNEATHPCEKACQQEKLDALFKAMDDAEISRHPKPSNSADCAAYSGHDLADVLLDVCAKLKYVRSLPLEETSRFSCPGDSASLVGTSIQRIVTVWGEPDFVQGTAPPDLTKGDGQWTFWEEPSRNGVAAGLLS